jgi:hypothetical protein
MVMEKRKSRQKQRGERLLRCCSDCASRALHGRCFCEGIIVPLTSTVDADDTERAMGHPYLQPWYLKDVSAQSQHQKSGAEKDIPKLAGSTRTLEAPKQWNGAGYANSMLEQPNERAKSNSPMDQNHKTDPTSVSLGREFQTLLLLLSSMIDDLYQT